MRPLDGYPTSFGSSRASVFPHRGPASYTQVVEGTAPANATGGDSVEAGPEAGMKYFDFLVGGESDSGVYRVEAIPTTRSGQTPVAKPGTTYTLRWFDASAGTEVGAETDLSDEIVRLFAIGPK